jgi:hypothetical protein
MSENLGFLTVIDQSPGGLTGGFLVLNRSGRPLEFHCTVPFSPGKIQQILYGASFQPFLYGERIAHTLIQRSKLPILSVLTDHAAVLPVQSLISTPIIYAFGGLTKVEISEELSESLRTFGIDNTHLPIEAASPDDMPSMPRVPGFETEHWQTIRIGNRLIAVPETGDESFVSEIKRRARTIDLLEPFARIRLALEEAKNAA